MKVLLSINKKTWSSHKFSNRFGYVWIWKRHYKRGHLWTPFVYLNIEKMKTKQNDIKETKPNMV